MDGISIPRTNAGAGAFEGESGASGAEGTKFPPIGEYAFLSDCESMCLIAPSGAVEWMCLPRPDSPSVFSAILDRSGGTFRLGPYDEMVPAARRYLPGSLMVETTWQTRTGWLIVRDALCMGPWHNVEERSRTHRRSPTDFDAEHCLLRTVLCVSGSVDLAMNCDPVFDYGRTEPTWTYEGPGYGEIVARVEGIEPSLRVTTDLRPGIERRGLFARTRLSEGQRAFVALSWSPLPPPRTWGRRPNACTARRSTGGSGSPRGTSPTTAGAATCNAAP